MNYDEYRNLILDIDSVNAEYILKSQTVIDAMQQADRYQQIGKKLYVDSVIEDLKLYAEKYDENHLTPANVKVGDGVTINLWSDRYAATIIKVTKSTVTVQRDKATLNPEFKPKWDGMHCTNQNEQSYTYAQDEKGEITKFYWSNKYQTYGQPGNLRLSKGRNEFYDYNF